MHRNVQEDMDKRFGNEKRKKRTPQLNAQVVRPAVDGGPGSDLLSEKPPKKLTYVEYKKYKSGARNLTCSLNEAFSLFDLFAPQSGDYGRRESAFMQCRLRPSGWRAGRWWRW